MSDGEHDRQMQFVERVALTYERSGLPRIAGRILGWLLICDPPAQTAGELAAALDVSKGSISTMTRMLITMGLIEHTSRRGDRRDYFHIPAQLWVDVLRKQFAQLAVFRQLAESGLETLKDSPAASRDRLEVMRDLYGFFERELPGLIERWEAEQRERP
jgi:DNA-binding transcriptional regulator GbsR (MarR family)